MKLFLSVLFLLSSSSIFAKDLNCSYLNHDGVKGSVLINIDEDKLSVVLTFTDITVSAAKCNMILKPDEITIECDEDENSIGIILELLNGKLDGVIISEKAGVFGQGSC